ncbi:hypothetical protein BDW62DRAFT_200147 [Aspergillus aurantiobrunneus]
MAKVLIQGGLDVARRNCGGLTPFHLAVWAPTPIGVFRPQLPSEMVLFPLEYQGIHGKGDVDNAIEPLDYDGASYVLLKAGAGVDALDVDSQGKTPIDRAVDEITDKGPARRAMRLLALRSDDHGDL